MAPNSLIFLSGDVVIQNFAWHFGMLSGETVKDFLVYFLLTLGQKYFPICALKSDCLIFKVLFYGVGRRTGLICGLMAA